MNELVHRTELVAAVVGRRDPHVIDVTSNGLRIKLAGLSV